ncbi:MAG: 2-iminoacetate synthase ThiH [Proteobacteria bacterium]|nr:2-iminoacetate synthase ThiH [Pseudomonadota bacterium]MBU4297300.1 2-iminoacetate synthase ThiH [Pseudomonadota bacterium]MCG2747734.1 2-iminoacetate synthase ThiH [Desulfobulbaceae bacterium]
MIHETFTIPDFAELQRLVERNCHTADVHHALQSDRIDIKGLAALLSPAAEHLLPRLAARSARITAKRFGRTIQIYAPLYLSNFCINRCAYCGFSAGNKIDRRVLTMEEAEQEAMILHGRGFKHILLVAGEAPARLGVDYLAALTTRLRDGFAAISIEVQPLEEDEYVRLFAAGITSVAVYQETYDRGIYGQVHHAGKKCDFDYRLATPARAAAAGMREVGIGALLGLADWRLEGLAMGMHLAWLRKHYWRTALTISFPRLRPAEGGFQPLVKVNERMLTQMIFALRIFDPDVGLLLSTREEARFRDGMVGLGPTRYSAGSCTAPGGYAHPELTGEQFSVGDHRSMQEVCADICQKGYDPVRKDWDATFQIKDGGSGMSAAF